MRVLLDECLPVRLRHEFAGHDAATVRYMDWTSQKNGNLLSQMLQAGFEVLVTADRHLVEQQEIAAAGIAVVVVHAPSNRTPDLKPSMPHVRAALADIQAGQVIEIPVPPAPPLLKETA